MFGLLVFAGIAGAGYYEDLGNWAVQYVTNPNTPTETPTVFGLIDTTTGLLWVNTWGTNPSNRPQLDNRPPRFRGSFFFSDAAVILGENGTGIGTDLAYKAIDYVFHNRIDACDTLDPATATVGIEPWWSDTMAFNNGNIDVPPGFIAPDISYWSSHLEGTNDFWPTDTTEISLEWILWDGIFLTLTENPVFQDEIDLMIAGIQNSVFYDSTAGTILYGGVDNPYLTALWSSMLLMYNRAFAGPVLMRETPVHDSITWVEYDYYSDEINKSHDYMYNDGWLYYMSNLFPFGGGEKDAADGFEDYECLAFLMSYSLNGDTAKADSVFDYNVREIGGADADDDEPDEFVQNIATYAASVNPTTDYWPLNQNPFDGMLTLVAFNEYHQFILNCAIADPATYWVYADTCQNWMRSIADWLVANYWYGADSSFGSASPNRDRTVSSGLAGYAMKTVPRLEILDVVADLPHEGDGIPVDYFANRTQPYITTVTVVAHNTIADSTDTVYIWTAGCIINWGTLNFQWEILPAMNPGDTAYVTFNMQASDCVPAPDLDLVWAELYGTHSTGYSVTDDDIWLEIDDPAEITVDDVVAVSDMLGTPYNEPFFTEGQNFWLEVSVTNTGDAMLKDLTLDISSLSAYGCASVFSPPYVFTDIDLPGGSSVTCWLPIMADTLNHGGTGTDDEIFTVNVSGVDSNTLDPVDTGDISYTDDDDSIGIVMPPDLHFDYVKPYATNPHPSGVINDWGYDIYWLNSYQNTKLLMFVYSTGGDYAIADSLDVYNNFITLFNSVGDEVVGINGTSPAQFIRTPTNVNVTSLAPGDTIKYVYRLSDNAIPPEFEGFVYGRFYADFHDTNRADAQFASTSPFDTTFEDTSFILGIDVTPPEVAFVTPYSPADPWPTDDSVWINATDNVSGVDEVHAYIQDAGTGNYWNGASWAGAYHEFDFTEEISPAWFCEIVEPTGVTSYSIHLWAVDFAGNASDTVVLPRGAVAYIHIYDVVSDLPREMVSGERWQADWLQEHTVTVHVYNEYSSAINNVVLGLRSSDAHTIIDGNPRLGTKNIGTLLAGEHQFIDFDVIEPNYSVTDDTLEAFLVGADPSGGRVVGEHFTDDDAYVQVEEPAHVYVYEVWNDAPTQVDDTGYVTYDVGGDSDAPQHFNVYAQICYAGEDTFEYLRTRFDNGFLHFPVSLVGMATFTISQSDFVTPVYDVAIGRTVYCTTISTEYMADTNECHIRDAEDMFIVSIDSFDIDNWDTIGSGRDSNPTIAQFHTVDTATYVTVLEPPRIDITDATLAGGYNNGGYIWINRTNSITIDVPFINPLTGCPDEGRATARLVGEDKPLVFFDGTWTDITGLIGLDSPTGANDTLYPGTDDTLAYTISWDGLTNVNTFVPYMADTIWFRNQYWQTEPHPVPWLFVDTTVSGDSLFIVPEMDTISRFIYPGVDTVGIDVVKPIVSIINPDQPLYSAWTWEDSLIIIATDNFSGVDDPTVMGMLVDPRGMFWNGTGWQLTTFWLPLLPLGSDRYWVVMPDTGDLVDDGIYHAYAKCSDIAGNNGDLVEIQFIYDSNSPLTKILVPDDGDTTVYYQCTAGDTIKVIAWDTVVVNDTAAVAGVKKAYVAIEDTLRHKWWDGTLNDWVSSMVAIYNEMTFQSDETWYYTDIVPLGNSFVSRVFTYADDILDNFDSPTDSLTLVVDCNKPEVFITDPTFTTAPPADSVFSSSPALPNTWTAIMNDALYGYVTDSIMAVDNIEMAICKDDTLWWDNVAGAFVTGSAIWFFPDSVDTVDNTFANVVYSAEINPGMNIIGADTVWFIYNWSPPDSGCYQIFVQGWDDVDNESVTASWSFSVDNMDPNYMTAYQPYYGQVCTLYTWESVFNETLRVAVYDSSLNCFDWYNNIDSAQIAVSTVISGETRHWNDGLIDFVPGFHWNDLAMGDSAYDSGLGMMRYLWNMWLPVTSLQNGTYNAEVQAWTQTGNYIHFYYNFIITGGLGYLTVNVLDPTPIFVGDSLRVEVAAHHSSGAIDTTFYYPITLGSNYSDPGCIDFTDSAFHLERGCDTIWVHPVCGKKGIILWANSAVSGYDAGNSLPFDVISSLDPGIFADVQDVTPDQGNQIMIIHTRSNKDPLYSGVDIDTSTLKVKVIGGYEYQRWLGGAWVDITPDLINESNDTLYVYYTPGDWELTGYQIVVNYQTNLGVGDFDTLYDVYAGSIAAHDDIEPAAVADVRIEESGGQVHLWWDEVTQGYDASAELDPGVNIYYIVYRCTTNPYNLAEFAFAGTSYTPEYFETMPVTPIATPTYYYVVAYDHDANSSDNSERVGRTSYDFGAAWGQIAVPFDIETGSVPIIGSEFSAYLAGAGITLISRWDNTIPDWSAVYQPPVVDNSINEGSDVLMTVGTGTAVLSIAGNLPATVPTLSYIADRWNSMFVPLNHPEIIWASGLIAAIPNCSAVAHRSPDRGWGDMCVYSGSAYYGDFLVYPGQGYLIWADAAGSWPTAKGFRNENETFGDVSHPIDCGSMPKALIGNIDGDWESVHFNLRTKSGDILLTDNSDGCSIHNGRFLIQVGNIDWAKGDEYILTVYTDDGSASDNIVVVVDDSPAQNLGHFFLKEGTFIPSVFALEGAKPNPFNATTNIKFDLPTDSNVRLTVYDVNGKLIRTLVSEELDAGVHTIRWDATDNNGSEIPTGVYFCKMKAGEFSAVSKLMFIK